MNYSKSKVTDLGEKLVEKEELKGTFINKELTIVDRITKKTLIPK